MQNIAGAREFESLLNEPVIAADLLEFLTPPIHFAHSTFENFRPDVHHPSQLEAVHLLKRFVRMGPSEPRSFFNALLGRGKARVGRGIYLDGGFGVGKTHLLAAAFHAYEGQKAYLTFQELMFLVGLQRLDVTMSSLANYHLLALDEFELDDPANTRIASTLLGGLMNRGVHVITTSNTPPGSLGKDRFSTEDFKRELTQLSERFIQVRIDGEDYRQTHHPDDHTPQTWLNPDIAGAIEYFNGQSEAHLHLSFAELREQLASAHPIRVRKALERFDSLSISDLVAFSHPHDALRFVYFMDKVYDSDIKLMISSKLQPGELFPQSLTIGGDKKKYLRTVSRLTELTHTRSN